MPTATSMSRTKVLLNQITKLKGNSQSLTPRARVLARGAKFSTGVLARDEGMVYSVAIISNLTKQWRTVTVQVYNWDQGGPVLIDTTNVRLGTDRTTYTVTDFTNRKLRATFLYEVRIIQPCVKGLVTNVFGLALGKTATYAKLGNTVFFSELTSIGATDRKQLR